MKLCFEVVLVVADQHLFLGVAFSAGDMNSIHPCAQQQLANELTSTS